MKSIGQQLREARLARKMTIEAASKATKIKAEQLLELENNNYARFAAPAYARGFIRIYARMLGLDEHRLIDQLDGFIDEQDEEFFLNSNPVNYIPDEKEDRSQRMSNREVGMMIAGGVMLCIIGVLAYRVFWSDANETVASRRTASTVNPPPSAEAALPNSLQEEPVAVAVPVNPWAIDQQESSSLELSQTITAPRATAVEGIEDQNLPVARALPVRELSQENIQIPRARPVNENILKEPRPPTDQPAARPADGLRRLVLLATEDCWVRVAEIKNEEVQQVFADQILAGEEKQFRAERFIVTAGVPAALKVFLDGKDLGILSEERLPMEFQIPKRDE
jgi:cytoskeleton protein RodZ